MSWRYQLPVSSRVPMSTLVRAFPHAFSRNDAPMRALESRLQDDLFARRALVTQSGTAALVLAIRSTVAPGGIVALPAYGCADLVSAAIRARVRVRLYDVDPGSLSADMASLASTLSRGVDALVVAHLFGVLADVNAVRVLAAERGVMVIEDAAQGLGAQLGGAPGGSLADWSVLSFGRGKGVNGGAGGALLSRGASGPSSHDGDYQPVEDSDNGHLRQENSGWRPWLMTSAQHVIGHPALYRIPANLPFLHLGEMVYKDAPEPATMPPACAVMALSSLISLPGRVEAQRAVAATYDATVPVSRRISPVPHSRPSWLRYPVRVGERVVIPKELGILRPYPATLAEQRHIGAVICDREPDMPGARTLRQELVTLPTHELMSRADVEHVSRWLERV